MTASFLLIIGVLIVWLAASGKWTRILTVVSNPAPGS